MSVTSQISLQNKTLLLVKSDLEEQRSNLIDALDRLYRQIRTLADPGPRDLIDESCGNSSVESVFVTYAQTRAQLRNVEAALERIRHGEFGICSLCGHEIGLKRLKALPWASNCIECQAQSERTTLH